MIFNEKKSVSTLCTKENMKVAANKRVVHSPPLHIRSTCINAISFLPPKLFQVNSALII